MRGQRGASLLAGLLLLRPATALALDPDKAITQYIHDVWRTEQGLPQNTVTAVAQTPDGYLWLGTREGLVRFDGVRFTLYDTRAAPELGHNFVLCLLPDRAGGLWIGTSGGGLVRHAEGRFTRYEERNGLPSEQVSTLLEDRQGRLWVGTEGGALARSDGERFVREPSWGALGTRIRALLERLVAARTAELAAANAELARLAREDGLTGLANRRTFDATLEEEWRRAHRMGSSLALILLDIDAFKAFHDQRWATRRATSACATCRWQWPGP